MRSFFTSLLILATAQAEVSFNNEVRPIISKNCMGCHGPDPADRKGDFHLDTFEGITKRNSKGRAGVIVGDPANSEIIKRVRSKNPEVVMPPPDHGHHLTEQEITTLEQWITEGANYEVHWALVAPKNPPVPGTNHPSPKNEIDHFVYKKLSEKGLEPMPSADPRVLLRRLALDLTGLPPSLEDVEAFAAEPTEANYQTYVKKFLAQPSYGEHWAALWLDIARYADTVGYSGDEHRDVWPWRDWVIDAFNDNMPYDEFTKLQIAGDLLPNATPEQQLATAFHRNTLNNNEGGTSDEEFRVIAVKDRISTTMNAWMGLTLRCAECHTHKYDPITHEEYYQFYDFFNQTRDNDQKDDRPRLELYSAKGRDAQLAALKQRIADLKETRKKKPDPFQPLDLKAVSKGGATVSTNSKGHFVFTGKNPKTDTYVLTGTTSDEIQTLRLDLHPNKENGGNVGRAGDGALVLSHVTVDLTLEDGSTKRIPIKKAVANVQQPNHEIKNVIGKTPHKNGWALNHPKDGYRGNRHALFELTEPIPAGATFTVSLVQQAQWPGHNIAALTLRGTDEADAVARYQKKELDPLGRKIAKAEADLVAPVRVPVMQDRKHPRKTHIMARGSYLQPTDEVKAGVPAALNPLPEGAPKNRLGIAQWLVADDNPLTARVAVNRLWARLFGTGIVETEEDFGIQGSLPTNQPLLDWLALQFQQDWDQKRLLSLIVTSHTYRQSAVADSTRLAKDPRNIYLSRGPRFRLSAEVVRDNALAVAGLLSDKRYGPPVYPPNPIKKYVNAFTGGMVWNASQGEDRHRRALYTYLKRSSPHPLFETFDMATRDVCNMRRIRTNTPLQSFMTLNDIAFIEAARSLAMQMQKQAPKNVRGQIAHGLHKALLRPGNQNQIDTLESLYQDSLARYQSDKDAASELAALPKDHENVSQLAALTLVTNVILNLDAFLTK